MSQQAQQQRKPIATPRRRSSALPWTVAALAAVVAVAAVVIPRVSGDASSGSGDAAPAVVETVNPEYGDTPSLARREPNDPTAMGEEDAPVVMLSYSDFQCPYCGKFAQTTEKQLIEKYVDSGVLRIEWRDFPYFGEESLRASHAARAAAEQDKFWEFHDAMYARQFPPNSGKLTQTYVTQVAREIGLDMDQFAKDLNSANTEKLVQHDFDEGQSIGLSGTPSFLINGVPIVGAMPVKKFEATIEQAQKDTESD